MSSPRVLVSILNWRTADLAIETVRSYQAQDYPDLHLQLVDNASPNDCVAEIRRACPGLDVKVLERNLGYTGGNNHALEQGLAEGYDHVIVSNQDVELPPDAVRLLVETAESHADAGVVGCVEVNHATDRVRAVRGGFSFWTGRAYWNAEVPAAQPVLEAGYVQGAVVLFTRRALRAGVRMNDDLFMYYDEPDVGFQLRRAGLRAYVDARVAIRHKNQDNHLNPGAGYMHQRNRVYMVHRYGRWYHRVAFHAFVALVELPAKLLLRTAQGHRDFASSCLHGYVDGVRGRMGPRRTAVR